MGCSPPGSLVHGIFQAWILEVKSLSRVQLFATPRTVVYQAPPSMGFSRQEYWSGLPFPSPMNTGVGCHFLLQWILEWVAISFSRGSSWPRNWTQVSHIVGRCFMVWVTREAQKYTYYPGNKVFPGGSVVKNLRAMQETWVWSLGWENPLEKEMATHSSVLARETPWTEDPGRLQSMELQRAGQDLLSN